MNHTPEIRLAAANWQYGITQALNELVASGRSELRRSDFKRSEPAPNEPALIQAVKENTKQK